MIEGGYVPPVERSLPEVVRDSLGWTSRVSLQTDEMVEMGAREAPASDPVVY